jgi:NADH-quinone oxidoreductase subunit H
VLFFGGWRPPVEAPLLTWVPPFFWLLAKVFVIVSFFVWFRATFPRYRYDQIMRLGWKVFIPLTIVWIVVVAVWMQTPWSLWK